MEILCLGGTDKRMYELVAPLIMNPAIIRQNNNYPFKTSNRHIWYIAINNGVADSFMPLKPNTSGYCIDNYYIRGDNAKTIDNLLKRITDDIEKFPVLTALVNKRHIEDFSRNGFVTWLELKNYNKMDYKSNKI